MTIVRLRYTRVQILAQKHEALKEVMVYNAWLKHNAREAATRLYAENAK